MVGLPNCRLHRRVLADLDRPAGKGDTPSLRTDSGARGPAGGAMIMRRREFFTLIGSAAAAWPLAARAQQPERMRRIGVLFPVSAEDDQEYPARLAAFVQALRDLGWSEGRGL